jgi:hypothetical protein
VPPQFTQVSDHRWTADPNLVNELMGDIQVTFPLASAGDETFQPDGVANNALTLQNAGAAVNGLTLQGTATGTAVALALRGDTNLGLVITPRGTGTVQLGANSLIVPAGQGVDTAAAGALVLGATNANAITLSKATTVSTGGIAVTGNSTITGTLGGLTGLTVAGSILGTANPAVFGATTNVQVQIFAFQASLQLAQSGGGGLVLQTKNSGNVAVNTLDDGSGKATFAGQVTVSAGGVAVTGASTLAGSLTLSGANNVLVAAARGLDTSAAGALAIGATTATSVLLGRSGQSLSTQALFAAGADQTGSRNITGGSNTNGTRRRRVLVCATMAGAATGTVELTYTTTVGGTTLTAVHGAKVSVAFTGNYQMSFEVDPGATYSVNTVTTGSGASATLVQWVEIDH